MRSALSAITFFLGLIVIWLARYFGEEIIKSKSSATVEAVAVIVTAGVITVLVSDWLKKK